YGSKNYCWITSNPFLLYVFGIPVLVVIIINIILMIKINRILMGIRAVANKSNLEKAKASLRASLALLPLLGITWLFGFLAISNGTLVFSYLFVILNSLQGTFVFYFHCLKYKDVKNYYRRFLTKCRITVSSMKISDGSKSHNTRAKEHPRSAWSKR
ncbi:Adhesion G-protein coupled receptor D1, partial [Trichoplax sp. H2]